MDRDLNELGLDTRERGHRLPMIEWLHDHLVKHRRVSGQQQTSAVTTVAVTESALSWAPD